MDVLAQAPFKLNVYKHHFSPCNLCSIANKYEDVFTNYGYFQSKIEKLILEFIIQFHIQILLYSNKKQKKTLIECAIV